MGRKQKRFFRAIVRRDSTRAALAAALMAAKDGTHNTLLQSEEIAIMLGWCEDAVVGANVARTRAGEKVRNEVRKERAKRGCLAHHQGCPDSCLLVEGERLLERLLAAPKIRLSAGDFELARKSIAIEIERGTR
jgi:hypothetical protein